VRSPARCSGPCAGPTVIGRLGGDEFAALLTRAKPGGAERVVRDFQRSLNAAEIAQATPGVQIRASVGIATSAGRQPDYESLLLAADRAMYARKGAKPPQLHGRDEQPA